MIDNKSEINVCLRFFEPKNFIKNMLLGQKKGLKIVILKIMLKNDLFKSNQIKNKKNR